MIYEFICMRESIYPSCRNGFNEFGTTNGAPRFECRPCDFDLCDGCWNYTTGAYSLIPLIICDCSEFQRMCRIITTIVH